MPDRRPAPLHAATRAQRGSRRSGPARSPAQDLGRAAPLGLPPRPRSPDRGGLEPEPQAHPAPLAQGGPARPAAQASPAGLTSEEPTRLRAERPNHVWALDFQTDETADGRQLRLLNVVDELTREALAIEVGRSITADATVATLDRLIAQRGTASQHIRCDNGPELTAHALRDWCRLSRTATACWFPLVASSGWLAPRTTAYPLMPQPQFAGHLG